MKLLYSTGVVGFIHHIGNTACKDTEKKRNYTLGMLSEELRHKYRFIIKDTIINDLETKRTQ